MTEFSMPNQRVTLLPHNVAHLECVLCGAASKNPWQWHCPRCGPDTRMDVVYHQNSIHELAEALRAGASRPFDMWRYREVLPLFNSNTRPNVVVGGTPLARSQALARDLGIADIIIKDEGRNASGSLKDRASAIGVLLAKETGRERIACASTGNAASSTACLAASEGLPATIFVPKRAPLPKVAQLLVFGAQVFRVDAGYDRTWDLCSELAERFEWFNRNCAINPFLIEGKKTAGLELAEQLGEDITDWVAVSVGDGCTVAGIGKGLAEAHQIGLIPRMPRLLGVQACGASPLVAAYRSGGESITSNPHTVADSICVGRPRNPHKALKAVRSSGGALIAVSDDAIIHAVQGLAKQAGVFGEPAAAAAVAGIAEAVRQGLIKSKQSVSIIVTGNGLKDPAAMTESLGAPIDIEATPDAVVQHLY